ncbi:unnamed protein product [Taenia asiatica]|uniref:Uncharacterized protein n=1 Tax=Taenia asiatica TaxID=60517 RepID=A0A3P6Q026_TAEAS|nr:unnamed protein product [Taenia asiatica]
MVSQSNHAVVPSATSLDGDVLTHGRRASMSTLAAIMSSRDWNQEKPFLPLLMHAASRMLR